nr:4Fe-4S dicluster domain-containing protein [Desulfobulbaceae bacterium]
MIFKVFPKKKLSSLYELLAYNIVVGPILKGTDRDGKSLYDFDVVYGFDELVLGYTSTIHSAKRFVLPYQENLSSFEISASDWQKNTDINVYKPLVFFGMHACDINALNKLDMVQAESVYPNPYYIGKRKSMFIIGINCTPEPQCFCQSMGTDTALHGFDLFITDIGEKYFVEILTSQAFELIKKISGKEPSQIDHQRYKHVSSQKNKLFTTTVDSSDLTKILDLEFDSKAWQIWGDKCLSCGTCANVCPTCYCYGVEENVDMDLKGATKTKTLHSCNLLDFASVAGGHNFRPESATRLKYRYYHKHRGFVEAFEEALCVGCGRCGESCLSDITPAEVIASVRNEV